MPPGPLVPARELAARIGAVFRCPYEPPNRASEKGPLILHYEPHLTTEMPDAIRESAA